LNKKKIKTLPIVLPFKGILKPAVPFQELFLVLMIQLFYSSIRKIGKHLAQLSQKIFLDNGLKLSSPIGSKSNIVKQFSPVNEKSRNGYLTI